MSLQTVPSTNLINRSNLNSNIIQYSGNSGSVKMDFITLEFYVTTFIDAGATLGNLIYGFYHLLLAA